MSALLGTTVLKDPAVVLCVPLVHIRMRYGSQGAKTVLKVSTVTTAMELSFHTHCMYALKVKCQRMDSTFACALVNIIKGVNIIKCEYN